MGYIYSARLTEGEYYDIEIDYYEKAGVSRLYLYQNDWNLAQLDSGRNQVSK